jgi:DNA-binding MarR family transcriptional regulator
MPAEHNESIADTLSDLNKLLGHRTRLGICVLLARHTAISFSRFKQLLGETDGNLGAQLRRLEDAGFIDITREFKNRKPVSWYTLTNIGREGLKKHLDAITRLMNLES